MKLSRLYFKKKNLTVLFWMEEKGEENRKSFLYPCRNKSEWK
jgi:hypothetical protein